MATTPTSPKNGRPSDASLLKYASMGTQMLVIMGLFTFGGYQLDKWLGWTIPVFTVGLSLIGIFAAFYLTLKDLLKPDRRNDKAS